MISYFLLSRYGEVSEWFKELVLKTSDSQEPWVRIPPSPPYRHQPKAKLNKRIILFAHLENYSRGRRGAPAKGVGWVTAARVQIPHSPPGKGLLKSSPFCIYELFLEIISGLNPIKFLLYFLIRCFNLYFVFQYILIMKNIV